MIDGDASPFQNLKSVIEAAKVPGLKDQFTLPEGIDILTFLAVTDQLTGVNEEQDRQIDRFLEINAGRSLDDRVRKEIATAPARKFLKRIEQKTKTDDLRDAVRKLILPPVETTSQAEN